MLHTCSTSTCLESVASALRFSQHPVRDDGRATRCGGNQRRERVAYTNRKGTRYYLCQGRTKTGKIRYYFAREPCEDAVTAIPAGYVVEESVNGIVSLSKDRP